MTIVNVTEKYELKTGGSYRCIADAVNSSKTAQYAFHIKVIRGMFFNKHLDKAIFKFKRKRYIIVTVSITHGQNSTLYRYLTTHAGHLLKQQIDASPRINRTYLSTSSFK